MKIKLASIVEQVVAAILAAAILTASGYIGGIITGRVEPSRWLWVGLVLLVVGSAAVLVRQTLLRLLRLAGRWVTSNWRLMLGVLLSLCMMYLAFVMIGTLSAALLVLGSILAAVLLAYSYAKHLLPVPTRVQKNHGELLENIEFGYEDSLTDHGWRIVQQAPDPYTHSSLGYATAIDSQFQRAFDRDVEQSARQGSVVEFVAKFREQPEVKRGRIYAHLGVTRSDGAGSRNVWINFPVNEIRPNRVGPNEWEFPVRPIGAQGQLFVFQVDLREAVRRTFGTEGWTFAELIRFRLRGSFTIARISICKGTYWIAKPFQAEAEAT